MLKFSKIACRKGWNSNIWTKIRPWSLIRKLTKSHAPIFQLMKKKTKILYWVKTKLLHSTTTLRSLYFYNHDKLNFEFKLKWNKSAKLIKLAIKKIRVYLLILRMIRRTEILQRFRMQGILRIYCPSSVGLIRFLRLTQRKGMRMLCPNWKENDHLNAIDQIYLKHQSNDQIYMYKILYISLY